MRSLYLFLLIIIHPAFSKAQVNLVPNPSFEDTLNCPTAVSGQDGDQIYNTSNWFPASKSADYYSSCALNNTDVSTPLNGLGFQEPHEGNSYVGMITYGNPGQNYREIVGVELSSNMQIGTTYYFSMYVSSTLGIHFPVYLAANNIGISLSNTKYETLNNPYPVNNLSIAFEDSIISDTTGWTHLTFSFTADSAYRYLYIGNFYDDVHTDTLAYTSQLTIGAYYFIDDVCLSSSPGYCDSISGIKTPVNNNFLISPNPFSESFYIKSDALIRDIFLYDVLGKLLGQLKFEKSDNNYFISDHLNLTTGLYFLRVSSANSFYTIKLQKF